MRIIALTVCMLLSGSVNTIATKYQVQCCCQCSVYCKLQGKHGRQIMCTHLGSCSDVRKQLCGFTCGSTVQDITPVGQTSSGQELTFKHPAVQSAFMFLGETLCFIPYFFLRWRKQQRHKAEHGAAYVSSGASGNKRKRRLCIIAAFALPALCDAAATTLLNVGLYYT